MQKRSCSFRCWRWPTRSCSAATPRRAGGSPASSAGSDSILAVFVTPLESLALHYLLTAAPAPERRARGMEPGARRARAPAGRRGCGAKVRAPSARSRTRSSRCRSGWRPTTPWHIPAAYDTALRNPSTLLHLEHLCYFVTGLVVWWPVLTGRARRRQLGRVPLRRVRAREPARAAARADPTRRLRLLCPCTSRLGLEPAHRPAGCGGDDGGRGGGRLLRRIRVLRRSLHAPRRHGAST